MENERTPLTKITLQRILAEFPTYDWSDQELDELVSPKHGVITGFQEIIENVRKLTEIDLKEVEPAGKLPVNIE
jgi:hypothetical protein